MSMLDETLKEWHDQTRREGREEGWRGGKEAGLKEGQLDGMRRLLLQVLEQRFGPLSSPVRQKVEAISSAAALQRLAQRALTARSLAALRLERRPLGQAG